jgi:hypothetical protein
MTKIPRQYRQGDVLLHPTDGVPSSAKLVSAIGPTVLAEGETTGHTHRIEDFSAVRRYAFEDHTYLEILRPVRLVHETHSALELQPGVYEVRRQVESWLDGVRRVRD